MSSNDSQKLRNCPFCGGEAEIIEVNDNPPETIAIQCKSGCGVSLHHKWMEREVLIERWNTRAERTCAIEDVTFGYTDTSWGRCSSCGRKFPYVDDVVACPNCGAKVKEER